MPRSRKILALLGVVLLLALTGCVRFQADLSVDENGRLDGSIIVAVITDDDPGSAENAKIKVGQIEQQLLPTLRGADGVTAQPYEEGDYVGERFTLNGTPIEALNGEGDEGAISLTRVADRYRFAGELDLTPGDGEDDPAVEGDPKDADIRVSMHFPGEVYSHNGTLDGTTVTWTTSLEGKVDMHAMASSRAPWTPSIALIAGVLVVAALLAGVIVLYVRRGRRESL